MKPNFQGILWDEFGGLGEDELKNYICWVNDLMKLLQFLFFVFGRHIDASFHLQMINVTRIVLTRSVFTLFRFYPNNKLCCPNLGTTIYVQFNIICLNFKHTPPPPATPHTTIIFFSFNQA
jgi:hypothetical protein